MGIARMENPLEGGSKSLATIIIITYLGGPILFSHEIISACGNMEEALSYPRYPGSFRVEGKWTNCHQGLDKLYYLGLVSCRPWAMGKKGIHLTHELLLVLL